MLLHNFVSTYGLPSDKIPLLDYKWSVTLNKPDGREFLDYGKGHSNGKLYFGRGVKFNGTDQNVSLSSSGLVDGGNWSMCGQISTNNIDTTTRQLLADTYYESNSISIVKGKLLVWVRGNNENLHFTYDVNIEAGRLYHVCVTVENNKEVRVYFQGELLAVEDFSGYSTTNLNRPLRIGYNLDGISSNILLSKGVLTPEQIEYQYNRPEKFLYSVSTTQSDGSKTYSLQSEVLTQDELDSVVAYLPMCETDKYVRNMVGYSEGVDLLPNGDFNSGLDGYSMDDDGTIELVDYEGETNVLKCYFPADNDRCRWNITLPDNGFYLLETKFYVEAGTLRFDASDSKLIGNEVTDFIVSDATSGWVAVTTVLNCLDASNPIEVWYRTRDAETTYYIAYSKLRKLTSTHQIENFTNSVRDEAMNLTYGLQTCFLKRDELGVPYNSSFDRLNCDGVGYVDTGYYVNYTEAKQIELVVSERYSAFGVATYGAIIGNSENYTSLYCRFNSGTTHNIGINCNSYGYTSFSITQIAHIVIDIKTDGYEVFHNGIGQGFKNNEGGTTSGGPLILGKISTTAQGLAGNSKLFKVHTTPQDPMQLYNEAVRKGLLDA